MSTASKKNRRKRIVAWVVGLAVVGLIAWALRPRPVAADFAAVERGPLRVTVDEEGETRVRHRYMVSAPVAGRVLRIELEPGDDVRANDTVVAILEPAPPTPLDARSRAEAEARVLAAEAAVQRSRAERDQAAAELRFARTDLERYRKLADDEVVSRERLDVARLDVERREEALKAADSSIAGAEQDLAAARARLLEIDAPASSDGAAPRAVLSPVDGVVLRRLRESEAVVPVGEPLVEIGNPDQLEIVSDLLSTDAVKARAGNPVVIEQWGGGEPLNGTVRRVEPYGFTKFSALGVEEQRVNVIVDFDDPREAWRALGDGYRVEVRIVVWEDDDVLKVPTSSLFRHGEDWAAYAVEGGRAVLRVVRIGRRDGLAAQVLDGLAAGESVIVHPSDAIEDGVAVVERSV